jgi:sarcosine oxidase
MSGALRRYDAAVIGLGAMGSAAALQLARRGARVLGLDRFDPPHGLGSSHGDTRVTRLAIGEGDHLTPLVMRSHELWREIERESGVSLLQEIGALIISSDQNAAKTHVEGFFHKTAAAAEKFGIAHELLDAAQIRARFPQFNIKDDEFGYFEPTAGYVRPEECVRTQLMLARKHGADLRTNETVLGFEASGNRVAITTDKGRHEADKLIVAAGPWLPDLLGGRLAALFQIYRQVQFWFEADPAEAFVSPRFPVFIWELQNSKQGLYGFPAIDGPQGGIKLASEQFEQPTTPQAARREVSESEIDAMRALVAPNLPGAGPRCLRATTCLYTVAPDFGFVIDRHPDSECILIASPCSGHGFKHSPAIGEALAEWALEGHSRLDLKPFGLARFA